MKKSLFIAVILIALASVMNSCTSSRKGACPMSEGITH